jgi:hypothetical protein
MAANNFSRLLGTTATKFQIGQGNCGWSAPDATHLENRTAGGAFAITRGADPVGANDYVTLGSIPSLTEGVNVAVRFAITNAAAQNSVSSLPALAVILRAFLDITTPYSAGATITVGTAAVPAAFMDTGDSTPQTNDLYDAPQDVVTTLGGTVLVTVAGAPAAGAGTCCVVYCKPLL